MFVNRINNYFKMINTQKNGSWFLLIFFFFFVVSSPIKVNAFPIKCNFTWLLFPVNIISVLQSFQVCQNEHFYCTKRVHVRHVCLKIWNGNRVGGILTGWWYNETQNYIYHQSPSIFCYNVLLPVSIHICEYE